jgi:glycosyltransferase involved in cell wall biosynthesis
MRSCLCHPAAVAGGTAAAALAREGLDKTLPARRTACPTESEAEDAAERSAPEVRAVHYPQTVFLPADIAANRDAFGLPHDALLFFMNIDVTSELARKNTAAAMANTIVIDRQLTYAETLSLNASCDVYVSLHRSEGLGLNLLQAMTLGRPVIVTGWSGNTDFMTPEDACLVGYELVPVRATHYAYRPEAIGPGQVWAEPSIAEAAAWMRRLADDESLRRRIGAAAQAGVPGGVGSSGVARQQSHGYGHLSPA